MLRCRLHKVLTCYRKAHLSLMAAQNSPTPPHRFSGCVQLGSDAWCCFLSPRSSATSARKASHQATGSAHDVLHGRNCLRPTLHFATLHCGNILHTKILWAKLTGGRRFFVDFIPGEQNSDRVKPRSPQDLGPRGGRKQAGVGVYHCIV